MKCWEMRGCDSEMERTCPHSVEGKYSPCPRDCRYAGDCDRPTRKFASDLAVLLDPMVDRRAAVKETCTCCDFFLKNAPRLEEGSDGSGPHMEDPYQGPSAHAVGAGE